MLTAWPRGQFPRWRRSRKRLSVCSVLRCPDLWLRRKDAPARCVFSKPCTKLTLHCNHRSGHLKAEHTESLFLLWRHLGNWPRGPAVGMRSELLVAHEKLGQLLLLNDTSSCSLLWHTYINTPSKFREWLYSCPVAGLQSLAILI